MITAALEGAIHISAVLVTTAIVDGALIYVWIETVKLLHLNYLNNIFDRMDNFEPSIIFNFRHQKKVLQALGSKFNNDFPNQIAWVTCFWSFQIVYSYFINLCTYIPHTMINIISIKPVNANTLET